MAYGDTHKARFSIHKRGNGVVYLSSKLVKKLLESGWSEKGDVAVIEITPSREGKLRFSAEFSGE